MAEYTSMVQPVRELAAAEYGETVADLRIEGLNSGSAAIVLLLTSVATCLVVIRIRSQTVFARHISGWRFLAVHRRFLIANSRALGGATAPVPPRPPGLSVPGLRADRQHHSAGQPRRRTQNRCR